MNELIDFLTSDGMMVLLFVGFILSVVGYAIYVSIWEDINNE